MSAIRKDAAEAPRAPASASVTAATACKGEAFSAASRTELRVSVKPWRTAMFGTLRLDHGYVLVPFRLPASTPWRAAGRLARELRPTMLRLRRSSRAVVGGWAVAAIEVTTPSAASRFHHRRYAGTEGSGYLLAWPNELAVGHVLVTPASKY